MDYKNPLKMIDPLTGMEMTMQPPVPANQMGVAKPVFSPQTQGMAQTIYGTPEQRQMSMGQQAPLFMKDIPEGDKGAGLRKLPNSVVEQMGYDSATRMVSPLNQKLEIGAKMVGKEIPKKMSKELTDKPRVPVVENTKQAFGITKDGKKVNLGKITSTEIPEKDFKQR
jgi:hypothetical protein